MKQILIVCLVLCALCLSCKTKKPVINTVSINTIERVVERFVPVEIPADSAVLTALLACDSLNNVYLKAITESKTKHVESIVALGNNTLMYRVKTVRDTVYVKADSVFIYKEKPVPAPYPVERELTWWQKTRIHVGSMSLLLLAILLGWKAVQLFYRIKI